MFFKQDTPKEGWRSHRLKCENNTEYEDNNLKNPTYTKSNNH